MMKRIAIGFVVLMTMVWAAGATAQVSARPSQTSQTSNPGRYQVVPATSSLYNLILLDTVTGDTWTPCLAESKDDTQYVKQWCVMARTAASAAMTKAPQTLK